MTIRERSADGRYACPCCGYASLSDSGGFDICSICFWEDDGQDDHNADVVRGGPNGSDSLTDARRNYLSIGACRKKDLAHVRPREANQMERLREYVLVGDAVRRVR